MKQKIVLFGCRKITIDAIRYITKNHRENCEICLVVTHDEEGDRLYHKDLVAEYCCDLNIPHMDAHNGIDREIIMAIKPDLIVSLYFRKIIPESILKLPSKGAINVHPSYLPAYRGPNPSLWNILNGDKEAGATLHYMTKEIDAGDIIAQEKIACADLTGFELNFRLMNLASYIFQFNFEDILEGKNLRKKQNELDATYCLPFHQSLRWVVWGDPDYILRQIRAFSKPFAGALTATSSFTSIVIFAGRKISERNSLKPPGFFELKNEGILVQTETLPILITEWCITSASACESLPKSGRFLPNGYPH